MELKLIDIIEIRRKLYFLNLNDKYYRGKYLEYCYIFIKNNEGVASKVYKDINNNNTIGIGFNMDSPNAANEWNEAFRNSNLNSNLYDNFEQVKLGMISLNNDQINQLFNHSRNTRLREIVKIYSPYWNKLSCNEQLAIEDAYFNSPKLVNSKTKFYQYIKNYADSRNFNYLKKAAEEIEFYSNPSNDRSIQKRRIIESTMLKTYEI